MKKHKKDKLNKKRIRSNSERRIDIVETRTEQKKENCTNRIRSVRQSYVLSNPFVKFWFKKIVKCC